MNSDQEASLAPTRDAPRVLTDEERAEQQAAFDKSKRFSEVVKGAGIKFTKRIQAKEAKGKIIVKGTSKTILKRDRCPCEEKLKFNNDDLKGAGGMGGKQTPFSMTSKFQSLVEAHSEMFSGRMDSLGYADAYIGWYAKVGAASDFDYSRTGNATLTLDCFNCRRIHKIRLDYEAPSTWPIIEIDPIVIWETFGVNLKNAATKRALDQFANRENMGLAKDGFDFINRELARMKSIEGQLAVVNDAIKELNLPGSGGDVKALEAALRNLDDRAEKAQRYFTMSWIFKALSYMGENWHKTADEAEKLLRGNWRPPEWYFEGR